MSDPLYTDTLMHARVQHALIIYSVKHTIICAPTNTRVSVTDLPGHPAVAHTLSNPHAYGRRGAARGVFLLPAALVSPADLCGYSLPNDLLFLHFYLYSRNHALNPE